MLAASLIGIFIIPALYVVFQSLRERGHRLAGLSTTGGVHAPASKADAETTQVSAESGEEPRRAAAEPSNP
ncbi:hypothetical protein D3C78_1969450 [compost metagenome]